MVALPPPRRPATETGQVGSRAENRARSRAVACREYHPRNGWTGGAECSPLGPKAGCVRCALGRIGPQEVGADGGVRTVPVISECVHPMLLSGVSGLSSTVGCRDCRDCRGVLDSARTWSQSLSGNILFAVGAVGLLSGLSGVGAVGTVERLSGSCRVRVSECRARAQLRGSGPAGAVEIDHRITERR